MIAPDLDPGNRPESEGPPCFLESNLSNLLRRGSTLFPICCAGRVRSAGSAAFATHPSNGSPMHAQTKEGMVENGGPLRIRAPTVPPGRGRIVYRSDQSVLLASIRGAS
jgi:hypothetical protein